MDVRECCVATSTAPSTMEDHLMKSPSDEVWNGLENDSELYIDGWLMEVQVIKWFMRDQTSYSCFFSFIWVLTENCSFEVKVGNHSFVGGIAASEVYCKKNMYLLYYPVFLIYDNRNASKIQNLQQFLFLSLLACF